MVPAEPRWHRIAAALADRLDGVQIADLLWMTQQLAAQIEKQPQADPDRPAGPKSKPAATAATAANLARETKGGDQASAASGKGPPPQKPEVLLDPVAGVGAPPAGSLTVSVAEAGLLHRQRRRIGRALAPLNRQVESGPARLLDVRATVDAIARARVDRSPWQPVLRPRPEPWLTLHLVFDDHPSMALWQQLRRELPRTLVQQVRWRDLRCWRLSRAGTGELELLGAHGRRCSPRQLRRPGGRDVVLVVSDAIAPCWRDGAMARQLGAWASQAPVLLLQVLPPRLWPRTGLGQQDPGWVLARRPLQPNGTLNWLPAESDPFAEPEADGPLGSPPPAPAAFTLPLASLEPESLAALARLLAGRAPGSLRAFRFAPPPETPATAPPAPQPAPEPDSQAIEQQLALFLFHASPQARRLLGLLTFAPVLTLPVVRLIQRLELAGSGPAQIAEVLFSGLFRNVAAPPAKGEPRLPADRQRLVFVEEALRDRLREGLRVGEARAVFDAVKAHVAASLNCSVESFEALLRQPPPAGSASASELLQAFATVAPSCLRGLGGRYDELADATEAAWAAVPQPVGPGAETPAGPVNALVLLGDGRLAAGGGDGAIRLWDPASGTCTAVFAGEGGPVLALAQLVDGRLASGGGDGAIRLWDLASGTCTAVLEGHGPWVRALAVVEHGCLASGSNDGTIRSWNPPDAACTAVLEGHGGPVKALAVLADGRLASGSDDGTIRIWDRPSGACSAVLEGHAGPVYALAVLADGRLVSGSTDRTIRLWDPGSSGCTAVLEGHTGSVAALVELADGRLASGSFDQTIRLWDPNGAGCLASHEQTGAPVRALADLADGRLAFAGADHTIHLWQPQGKTLQDLEPFTLGYETAQLEEIALQPITFTTTVLDEQLRQRDSQGQGWALREPLGADGTIALTMVQISAGSFLMGSPSDEPERNSDEGPQHEVTLASFLMGQTPITQAQWDEVASWQEQEGEHWGRELNPNPSRFSDQADSDNRPVERVSWFDAMEFCNRLSQRTGRSYTLPSEAQWEYACRAGTTTPFYCGATITPELANYNGNYTYANGPKGVYREQTTPVASFLANDWGLYDMHGNVREWCLDHWHGSYKGAPSDGSAWLDTVQSEEEDKKKVRLLRGGSWVDFPRYCRSAYRLHVGPGLASIDVGFRVVCLPQGPSLNA